MAHKDPAFLRTESCECDSTQNSTVTEQLRVVEDPKERSVDYASCSVLLCSECSTVVADSLSVCGEVEFINSIISLKVTEDVSVSGKFEVCMEGVLAFCSYRVLECSVCLHFVGVVLHSTPPHLSSLQNLFLLQKDALNCYLLKDCALLKASKISFETRPLRRRLIELKEDLEAQMTQVDMLKEMVEELSVSSLDRVSMRSRASSLCCSTTMLSGVTE